MQPEIMQILFLIFFCIKKDNMHNAIHTAPQYMFGTPYTREISRNGRKPASTSVTGWYNSILPPKSAPEAAVFLIA